MRDMAVAEGGAQACAASRVLPCSLVLARSEARRLPDWGTFDTRENFMRLMAGIAGKEPELQQCVALIGAGTPERIEHAIWRKACKAVASEIEILANQKTREACDDIYCALQQISSILRTKLAAEVRSRLAVDLPR